MPFSRFRLLNGDKNPQQGEVRGTDAAKNVVAIAIGSTPANSAATKIAKKAFDVIQIDTAKVSIPGGDLKLAAPLVAPTGEHFDEAVTVLSAVTASNPKYCAFLLCKVHGATPERFVSAELK